MSIPVRITAANSSHFVGALEWRCVLDGRRFITMRSNGQLFCNHSLEPHRAEYLALRGRRAHGCVIRRVSGRRHDARTTVPTLTSLLRSALSTPRSSVLPSFCLAPKLGAWERAALRGNSVARRVVGWGARILAGACRGSAASPHTGRALPKPHFGNEEVSSQTGRCRGRWRVALASGSRGVSILRR